MTEMALARALADALDAEGKWRPLLLSNHRFIDDGDVWFSRNGGTFKVSGNSLLSAQDPPSHPARTWCGVFRDAYYEGNESDMINDFEDWVGDDLPEDYFAPLGTALREELMRVALPLIVRRPPDVDAPRLAARPVPAVPGEPGEAAAWILTQELPRRPQRAAVAESQDLVPNQDVQSPVAGESPELDSLVQVLMRYVVWPEPWSAGVVALWVAHTYIMEKFDTTPRLAVLSPHKGSGKTRVVDLLSLLAHNPRQTVSASASSLFRTTSAGPVTLLVDEIDTVWSSPGSEDIRSILNGGYKRGGSVMRSSRGKGDSWTPKQYDTFAPAALAGLGELPTTVLDRSIVIRMKKRRQDEPLLIFRLREVEVETEVVRSRLKKWTSGLVGRLVYPEMPEGLTDRPAEIWEPLIQIADASGPSWGRFAREAALASLHVTGVTAYGGSTDTAVLAAVVQAFEESGVDRLATETLITRIHEHEDPRVGVLTPIALAQALAPYEVKPKLLRFPGEHNPKRGYDRADLQDASDRYL